MTPLKKQLLGTTALTPESMLVREPVTAILGALGIGGGAAVAGAAATKLTFGSILAKLAISVVASFILQALAPKPKVSGGQGLVTNLRDPAAPHEIVYGRVRKGGVITYMESTGANNRFLHMIVVLAGHEVNAIGDIYINDEVVTLDGGGFVTGAPWNSKIRIKKYLGTATQTADPDLLAESAQIDANFRGRGLAYLYIRMEHDQNVFSNGIPLFTALVEGKKVFDPRTSTTAWSANAALCIRDYLTSAYGLNDAAIDAAMFSAAANDCADAIPLAGGGTQPRYEMHGVLSTGDSIGTNLDKMVTSCAASLFWGQGNWKLKVGKYAAPVASLDLDDLRSGINLSTRVARRDNFNIVRGKFNDKDQDYIVADYPEVKSAAFISEDAGIENPLDFELPLTTDSAMAQRIAKLALFRGREQMTLTADFGLAALGVQVGDIVSFTNSRYGWTSKEFEVVGWNLNISGEAGDLRVSLSLRETSSAAFDWNAEESDIIGNNTNLPDWRSVGAIGLAATARVQVLNEKISNIISLNVSAASTVRIDRVEVQFKTSANVDWNTLGSGPLGLYEAIDLEAVDYDFRARAVNEFGYTGDWETLSNVSAVGLLLPPDDATGLTAEVNGATTFLDWEPVTNPELSHYVVRHAIETTGASWANATTAVAKVARPASDVSVPSRPGTYMVKAVDKYGSASVAFTSTVVTQNQIGALANVLTDAEHATFAGVKTGTVVSGGELLIAGNAPSEMAFRTYSQGDTVLSSDYNRGTTGSLFAAVDLTFPASAAAGCIWEIGGGSIGTYLGVTSGNLVFRAYNAAAIDAATARIAVSVAPYLGKRGQLLCQIDAAVYTIRLWFWDSAENTLSLVGQATASGATASWAGSDNGGVGVATGTIPGAESSSAFNGTIFRARFWNPRLFTPSVAALPASGTYDFTGYLDTGAVRRARARIDATTRRQDDSAGLWDDIPGLFDSFPGLFDDFTGGAQFADTNVLFYISATDDDPAGTPTWGAYQLFRAGEFYGRAFRFRIVLKSESAGVTPAISALTARVEYA